MKPEFLILEEVGPGCADDGTAHDKFFFSSETDWLRQIEHMLGEGREPICFRLTPATFTIRRTLVETTP